MSRSGGVSQRCIGPSPSGKHILLNNGPALELKAPQCINNFCKIYVPLAETRKYAVPHRSVEIQAQ
jgi:hypothetical protein